VADDRRTPELERRLISERTRAGVKAAQRRGVKFGRKVKLTAEQINHARKLLDKGEARQYVADLLNVGRSTLYRALLVDTYRSGSRLKI
jgi:DNA invertase Pin-like site-specific DNA recombinase